jgi:predicted kinase
MPGPFVVVSGLPGSGKTTLAHRLAPALQLPLIDKDDILKRLFETRGIGDTAWRRQLSRESDEILQQEARAAGGAVLSSFWHLHGMPSDSGTPTDWLLRLSAPLVNVYCVCPPETAASRFRNRKRHPGHLDGEMSHDDLLANLRQLALLGPLDISPRIDVDTSQEPDVTGLVAEIRGALAPCRQTP